MSYAFAGATSFDKMLFWNTSQATTMKGMFSGASSFNGDINTFDVSNVVDFSEMVRYSATSIQSGTNATNQIAFRRKFSFLTPSASMAT
jgi:Mycoplasma protein of unknown function, DUF285